MNQKESAHKSHVFVNQKESAHKSHVFVNQTMLVLFVCESHCLIKLKAESSFAALLQETLLSIVQRFITNQSKFSSTAELSLQRCGLVDKCIVGRFCLCAVIMS